MNARMSGYSIADIGTFPWVMLHDRLDLDLAAYPNLNQWYAAMSRRPSVDRAYNRMKIELPFAPEPSQELLKSLFGSTAALMTPPAKNFARSNPLES
jgi:GSH-dependent disulfide-bond oxidoreductase